MGQFILFHSIFFIRGISGERGVKMAETETEKRYDARIESYNIHGQTVYTNFLYNKSEREIMEFYNSLKTDCLKVGYNLYMEEVGN